MAKQPAAPPGQTPFDDKPAPQQQDAKTPRRSGPIMDDEMKVMNQINRAIAKLPTEAAKIRVMKYMVSRS